MADALLVLADAPPGGRKTEPGDAANESPPQSWWRLSFTDRGWREIAFAPPVTRTEALLLYPEASNALPVLESEHRA